MKKPNTDTIKSITEQIHPDNNKVAVKDVADKVRETAATTEEVSASAKEQAAVLQKTVAASMRLSEIANKFFQTFWSYQCNR